MLNVINIGKVKLMNVIRKNIRYRKL
jgi:hypothetical protein